MSKSVFLFIPAIFIVLLLAAINGKYQLTPKPTPVQILPTPVPETTWQTYRNDQYGFEFQYPTHLPPESTGFTDSGNDEIVIHDQKDNWKFSFLPTANPKHLSLRQLAESSRKEFVSTCPAGYDSAPVAETSLSIPGSIGFSVINCPVGYYFFYYLPLDKETVLKIKQFFINDNSGSYTSLGQFDEITNQILSTFKFIDQSTPKLPQVSLTITSTSSQIYQDQNVSFVYPSTFEKEPLLSQGSGYTQEFNDDQGGLFLSFSSKGNYNQVTGKAYSDINEYIGMPHQVKEVFANGQSGRQPLPRAGSENVFSAVFFSKDSKIIYTLELKAGDTPLNTPVEKVAEGELIFTKILSTFKFIDPVSTQRVKIKDVIRQNNGDYLVNLDFVEWIDDQSSPDGYRIVNNNTLIRTFKLTSDSRIDFVNPPENADYHGVSASYFYSEYKTRPSPYYEIKYRGDTILSLKEIYTP